MNLTTGTVAVPFGPTPATHQSNCEICPLCSCPVDISGKTETETETETPCRSNMKSHLADKLYKIIPRLNQRDLHPFNCPFLGSVYEEDTVAFCHGVSSHRVADDETMFTFDTCVGGKPFGPCELMIKFKRNQTLLKFHNLPYAVPTRALYRKHLEDAENPSKQLVPFIRSVFKHLWAFFSRKHQYEQLKHRFAADFTEFRADNHFTDLCFSLHVKDQESEVRRMFSVNFALTYAKAEDRPTPGTLGVYCSPLMGKEDRRCLLDQCQVFYSMRLPEAVDHAF